MENWRENWNESFWGEKDVIKRRKKSPAQTDSANKDVRGDQDLKKEGKRKQARAPTRDLAFHSVPLSGSRLALQLRFPLFTNLQVASGPHLHNV